MPPSCAWAAGSAATATAIPFVTADDAAPDLALQAETALRFYLDEVHELGAELSLSDACVAVSDELQRSGRRVRRTARRIARTSPIGAPSLGIYARLAATARALDQRRSAACAHAARRRALCATPASSGPTSNVIDASLQAQRLGRSGAAGACVALRRAVDVFGFHLATLDLRQNSDVHEAVVARAARGRARPARDYAELTEDDARRAAAGRARARRGRSRLAHLAYSEDATAASWRSSTPRDECAERYGRAAFRNCIISKAETRLATCWRWRCC